MVRKIHNYTLLGKAVRRPPDIPATVLRGEHELPASVRRRAPVGIQSHGRGPGVGPSAPRVDHYHPGHLISLAHHLGYRDAPDGKLTWMGRKRLQASCIPCAKRPAGDFEPIPKALVFVERKVPRWIGREVTPAPPKELSPARSVRSLAGRATARNGSDHACKREPAALLISCLPCRGNPPAFSIAGLRKLPTHTTALAPLRRRATFLLPITNANRIRASSTLPDTFFRPPATGSWTGVSVRQSRKTFSLGTAASDFSALPTLP
jgi:hypothetical protein